MLENPIQNLKNENGSKKQKRDEKIFSIAISLALLFFIFSWIWVFKWGVPIVHSLHQK